MIYQQTACLFKSVAGLHIDIVEFIFLDERKQFGEFLQFFPEFGIVHSLSAEEADAVQHQGAVNRHD